MSYRPAELSFETTARRGLSYFSTENSLPSKRRKSWEETVCAIYPKTLSSPVDEDRFYAQVAWRKVGEVMLSEIHSSAQTVSRRSDHIRHSDRDIIALIVQIEGSGRLVQDCRECITQPGEFAVCDSSRPYEMSFDAPIRSFCLAFPRNLLSTRFGTTENVTARSIGGTVGPGRFLYSYIHNLIGQSEEDDALIAHRLQEHLVDLLITSFGGITPDTPGRTSMSRAMTLIRLKTFINENLREHGLSPASIAKAQRLSLRYVYDLFEDEGESVRRWIQRSRLDRCRADIENPAMLPRSLGDIAFSWGFSDPAHFSRAFRKRFEMSPRQCRSDMKIR